MPESWETAFTEKLLMWGLGPARSALLARDCFARAGAKEILIPGVGYGRNAKVFLDHGIRHRDRDLGDRDEPTHGGGTLPFLNVVCREG